MGKRENDWKKNGSPFEKDTARQQGKTVQELRKQSQDWARKNRGR